MKFIKIIVSVLLMTNADYFFAKDDAHQVQTLIAPVVNNCVCVPTEHWFYKSCVKLYNKQFVGADLPENNNTEDLPVNVLQAIEMLAADILFIDANGNVIVPELSARGNLILPMSRNVDYKLCKNILHNVDVSTTLTAEELYAQWKIELNSMKSAQ
ncbi:MAG: hypothetical protein JO129_02320 [Candidatus Dependentiae bacterium]|nr:hypothetical protein [Candidatus Dependentiae bacterium]